MLLPLHGIGDGPDAGSGLIGREAHQSSGGGRSRFNKSVGSLSTLWVRMGRAGTLPATASVLALTLCPTTDVPGSQEEHFFTLAMPSQLKQGGYPNSINKLGAITFGRASRQEPHHGDKQGKLVKLNNIAKLSHRSH